MLAKLLKKHNSKKTKEKTALLSDVKNEPSFNKENQVVDKKLEKQSSGNLHKQTDKIKKPKKSKNNINCGKSHGEVSFEINPYSSQEFDNEMEKLDRLALINASARFDLLTANQQLLHFKLNKILSSKQSQYQEAKQNGDKPLRVDTADEDVDQEARKQKFQNPVEMIQSQLINMSPLAFSHEDNNF